MKRILIVDDSVDSFNLVEKRLGNQHSLQIAGDLATAERMLSSVRNTTTDKVTAFMIGADDFITKPFDLAEFVARVEAKLRQKEAKDVRAHTIQVGELEIDQDSQRVSVRTGETVEDLILTALELRILTYLSRQKNRVVSRNEILDSVWGQNVHVFARNVDTHVSKLRKKLGRLGPYIQSSHGKGYCFAPPDTTRIGGISVRSEAPV